MNFTDEQLEILQQARPHFDSARRGFIRNAPRYLTEQVINVYESTGRTILSKDLTCAVCVLRIYQAAGALYFKDIEERQRAEEMKPTEEAKTEQTPTTAPKKKSKKSK